jgi:hypothetical protein
MTTTTDYKEATVTGQSWQRCNQIVIENPRHATPVVRFDEERVLVLQTGSEVRTPVGTLTLPFDADKTIPLRNPATGELTGNTTTYGEAYALLYSAYLAAATERDGPPAEATPETQTTTEA